MGEQQLHHGGNLDWARNHFAFKGENWLDLSTGINPLPYPIPEIPSSAYARLPDQSLEQQAYAAACAYYGAPHTNHLALAPGSQALIQWLPRLRGKSRVAIVEPTYQEHARCWALLGHEVTSVDNLDQAAARDADVVIVVRPNNPTGAIADSLLINDLAEQLVHRDGWLIIDEAFADILPEPDLLDLIGHPAVILLKSFGKFFGLAGLRLGITISHEDLSKKIREAIGPWAVPGPTLAVAAQAYQDRQWIEATRLRLEHDAERLDGLLRDSGCEIFGGISLFRLAAHPQTAKLMRHLGDSGILVRPFPYAANWLRFGLPGKEAEWNRQTDCLDRFNS